MKFDPEECHWFCRVAYKCNNSSRQCNSTRSVFTGSKLFVDIVKIRLQKIHQFTKFCLLYFDTWSTIKTIDSQSEMCYNTAKKWATTIRVIIGQVRNRFPITLADKGSVIEMDATYYGKEWKHGKKGKQPVGYKTRIWFRMIERDWTPKGRHRRLSFIVRAESMNECVPLMEKHISAHRQVKVFADGCAFGKCKKLDDMKDRFDVEQCSHSDEMWTKFGTKHLDAHNKVHDNTAEASFQYDKLLHKSHYGLDKHNLDTSRTHLNISDWRNNYTDMTSIDSMFTFVNQCCQIYPCKVPCHMR